MIHHLSYPEGSSVNDFIPHEFSSVHYSTISEAIDFIKHSPHLVYIAKVDIEFPFRIIPISPADRPFLGFQWRASFSRTPCCLWGVPVLARFLNVSVPLWVGLLKLS